jgi:hypothetical protein
VTALSASGRLRLKIELAYPALRESTERLWQSPLLPELYPIYLVTMHGITRAATPLMEAAGRLAERLARDDEVAAALVPYLQAHAPEEAGHERWLAQDLEALGIDHRTALDRMPGPTVATLVGAQYYWMRHHHPVALLGHMAVVEGYPPQPGFARRLRQQTGFPADAFRTLTRHEELDAGHRQELYGLIDSLPLRPDHEAMMGVSALHTVQAATAVFNDIFAQGASDEGALRMAQASTSGPTPDVAGWELPPLSRVRRQAPIS